MLSTIRDEFVACHAGFVGAPPVSISIPAIAVLQVCG
jgi:hypothetical protein